jgi:hypothetical protein
LSFPLGCPAPGYDTADVVSFKGDWLLDRPADRLELLADDAARELVDETGWRGLQA